MCQFLNVQFHVKWFLTYLYNHKNGQNVAFATTSFKIRVLFFLHHFFDNADGYVPMLQYLMVKGFKIKVSV